MAKQVHEQVGTYGVCIYSSLKATGVFYVTFKYGMCMEFE